MDKKNIVKILILFVFLAICGTCSTALAKVYIDIDAPGFQQFPIAVCDFQNKNPATPTSSGLHSTITDEIKNYLDMTGLFKILDKEVSSKALNRGTRKKSVFRNGRPSERISW